MAPVEVTDDLARARAGAWQCLADAEQEGDREHVARARARLVELGELPPRQEGPRD